MSDAKEMKTPFQCRDHEYFDWHRPCSWCRIEKLSAELAAKDAVVEAARQYVFGENWAGQLQALDDALRALDQPCKTCGGKRYVTEEVASGHLPSRRKPCPVCGTSPCDHERLVGSRSDMDKPTCETCGGSGELPRGWGGEDVTGPPCPDCGGGYTPHTKESNVEVKYRVRDPRKHPPEPFTGTEKS